MSPPKVSWFSGFTFMNIVRDSNGFCRPVIGGESGFN